MPPDYDDSDLTRDEMIELAKRAFDDADNADPIPTELSEDDREHLALSRSEEFQAILEKSQRSLEKVGGLSTEKVRRRLAMKIS